MRYITTEDEIKNGLNKIFLEEDEIELQINYIDKVDDVYVLNTRAIVEGEAYNNFEVEVQLLDNAEISCVADIIEKEWDWYDLINFS